jgi:L-fuculose-phosphate aldolase
MVDIKNIRKSICEISKLLYDKDISNSSGGNISVRDGDLIYITQSGSGENHQWEINEDSIIITDIYGKPFLGNYESISRESLTHHYIYQNFDDVNAVIHCHPTHMMVFGALLKDIPAFGEVVKDHLGDQPITCTPEVKPCSEEQAQEVVNNFKKRRKIDPNAGLICNIPNHGVFAAGSDLNATFVSLEAVEVAAKIVLFKKFIQ